MPSDFRANENRSVSASFSAVFVQIHSYWKPRKHVEDGEYYRASTNRWNKLGRATISNPILHIARAVW